MKLLKINAIAFLCIMSQYAGASGYHLLEQNASDLGRAFSGDAALADNATIEYANPAGMMEIKKPSISGSAVLINAHTHFVADSSTNIYGVNVTGVREENPLKTKVVPSLHYVHPINSKLTFGFGITEPFGLATEYDSKGLVRYFATKSDIVTINFNPSLAYAVTDKFFVGVGVSAQYLTANLDRKLDAGAALSHAASDPTKDVNVQNSANDWGYGANFGLMYKFTPNTIVGFSYRSEIHHQLKGDLKVQYPATLTANQISLLSALGYRDGKVDSNINLPEVATLSLFQRITDNWDVTATASFTHWGRFNYLTLKYDTGLRNVDVHENFQDSMRYAIGTDYKLNESWTFRFGTAYDNSPVQNSNRNVSLPDADRFWLACGANYAFNRDVSIDLGYAYLFLKSGTVDDASGHQRITGHYNDTYVNLFGLQLNWQFG